MACSKYTRIVLTFILFIHFSSCQETPDSMEPAVDQEMVDAMASADAYLASIVGSNGRIEDDYTRSVTNLRFSQQSLVYKTDEVSNEKYDPIGEQTISAQVIPGEYIFWNTGNGLTEIVGIEFDSYSMQFLEYKPQRANDNLWVARIKSFDDDDEDDDIHLKYDIIYKASGSSSPVRLDPKIKIRHQE